MNSSSFSPIRSPGSELAPKAKREEVLLRNEILQVLGVAEPSDASTTKPFKEIQNFEMKGTRPFITVDAAALLLSMLCGNKNPTSNNRSHSSKYSTSDMIV